MSKKEVIRPVVERKYTIANKLRRVATEILVLLFVFCLGFILNMPIYTDQQIDDQLDDFYQFVYMYDTQQKIEDYYKMMERAIFNEMGFSPESPESKERMAEIRKERPLVAVEQLAIFVDSDNGILSVRERPLLVPLLELKIHEQSKRLELSSSLEKGWTIPRFGTRLFYSEDGVYEWGFFCCS